MATATDLTIDHYQRLKDEITADNPLGKLADTLAYTLGVDIDKGDSCDIENPGTREAIEIEAAAPTVQSTQKRCFFHHTNSGEGGGMK